MLIGNIMSYFAVDRAVFDHPIFSKEPFSRRDAWVWLISEAKFKESDVFINGRIITLKRGQLSHSLRFISSKWGWDKGKTERFFRVLKTETMIETATETGQIIITICNYDRYQGQNKLNETENETANETRTRQQRDSSETKKKKDNKEIKEYTGRFLEFWEFYPRQRRGDIDQTHKAWVRALTKAKEKEIMDGLQAYIGSSEVANGFAKGAAAWLNASRWTDQHNRAKEEKSWFG
jgi:hypothetical protein